MAIGRKISPGNADPNASIFDILTGYFKKFFLLAIAIGVAVAFLFNDRGLIAWFEYSNNKANLESDLDSLKAEEKRLRSQIDRLKNDPVYLEKIAREKYGMAKEGEKVYKIIPEEKKAENEQ